MSGIRLDTPVSRGSDSDIEVSFIGINYDQKKVIVQLAYQPSGQTRVFTFEGDDLLTLRNVVPQFAGLRTAILRHLQGLANDLGGLVS